MVYVRVTIFLPALLISRCQTEIRNMRNVYADANLNVPQVATLMFGFAVRCTLAYGLVSILKLRRRREPMSLYASSGGHARRCRR